MEKERHGFLTFWFVSGIILNIFALTIFVIALDDPVFFEMSRQTIIAYILLSLLGVICNILLLNWKIAGFYISIVASICTLSINRELSTIAFAFLGPILVACVN